MDEQEVADDDGKRRRADDAKIELGEVVAQLTSSIEGMHGGFPIFDAKVRFKHKCTFNATDPQAHSSLHAPFAVFLSGC